MRAEHCQRSAYLDNLEYVAFKTRYKDGYARVTECRFWGRRNSPPHGRAPSNLFGTNGSLNALHPGPSRRICRALWYRAGTDASRGAGGADSVGPKPRLSADERFGDPAHAQRQTT